MLRKLISETVHKQLLEYASKNDEVSEASNRLCNVIYQLYEQLLETHQDIVEGDVSDYNLKYPSKMRYNINWGELPKPSSNLISVGDIEFFKKDFDLNVVIFFIDRKNYALVPKYELTLKRNVPLGSVNIPGLFNFSFGSSFNIFTNPSINFFFTSSMIEDGSFRSTVEHEMMHAFQTNKKVTDKNGKTYYHDITETPYSQLQKVLNDYKSEDNVRLVLRILYLLEPTEKSAWMQGIISDLQQSYEIYKKGLKMNFFTINEIANLKSEHYDEVRKSFSQFEYMLDTDNTNEMVYRLSEYLSQYVPYHQHVARKIIKDFLDYKKKLSKIYYQHNQVLINKLRNEVKENNI